MKLNPRRWAEAGLAAPVAGLALVACLSFESLFGSWSFLPYAVFGVATALVVAMLARVIDLTSGETVALSLVAFVAVGVATTQARLSPDSFVVFWEGLTAGWARGLSSLPPVALSSDLRVLPFASAWLGTTVGIELLRLRVPGLAIIGPMTALILSMLMSFDEPAFAAGQGAVLAAGALIIGYIQQQQAATRLENFDDPTITKVPKVRGLLSALAMLGFVGLGAWFVGPQAPLVGANERFDLRDYQDPPFDPLREPSPLAQVKAALQEQNADEVVFSVTSDEPISRFPLAVLDAYNNEFWMVVDEESDSAGRFLPVDSTFPEPDDGTIDGWERVSASFEISKIDQLSNGDFDPVWMPSLGWPLLLTSDDPLDLRFNPRTGTVALAPDGPTSGTTYEMVAAVPPSISESNLRSDTISTNQPFDLGVPQLGDFASNVLEGADDGWEQVEAIRVALADGGAYDSRQGSHAGRPGHSLARLAEFVDNPAAMAGFEEQYAAVAALVARSEGIPARVVVGFSVPPDELENRWDGGRLDVVANDISAWIEVRFDEAGWMPFDVTPDRDRLPEDIPQGRSEREVAFPNPPPPPPPPLDPPPLSPDAEIDEDEGKDERVITKGGFPYGALATGAAASLPILFLLLAPFMVILAKRRRRRRRRGQERPPLQVAGAWYELVDRLNEQGVGKPDHATPAEWASGLVASGVMSNADEGDLQVLVKHTSAAAYHPEPVSDEVAEQAWKISDRLVAASGRGQRFTSRIRKRLNPRPLWKPDPVVDDGTAE